MALTRVTTDVIEENTILGSDIAEGTIPLGKLIDSASPGDTIVANGVGDLEYRALNIGELDGITQSGADIGDALVWTGSGWAPSAMPGGGGSGVSVLDDLLDVSFSALAATQVMKYNGTSWVNTSVDYSELTGTPTIPAALNDLSDATITSPVATQFMVHDGANWINVALAKSMISDFVEADYATAAQGLLADSAIQSGANVSVFANDAGYLTAITAPAALGLTTVATSGSYNDLLDIPTEFNASAHAHTLAEITDFNALDYATALQGTRADLAVLPGNNVSLLANDVGYITALDGVVDLNLATVATTGDYTDLINIPTEFTPVIHTHVKAQITDFSDGDYATAAQGATADSATQPGDLATVATTGSYLNLTNVPVTFAPDVHTHVKAQITDFSDGDYATAGQGLLANTSMQPGFNVSLLNNDSGYLRGLDGGAASGQALIHNGTSWMNQVLTKSNISDFNDADYANAAQGILAGTAVQPGANVSVLVNDAGYFADVNVTGPIGGQALMYNGVTWANRHLVTADITDYDDSIYATAAQGIVADSATQPGDNVSIMTNDIGYLTGQSILNDMFNVITPTVVAGEVLRFDGAAWVNSPDGAGQLELNDIINVNVPTPANGQVLKYDGANWVAAGDTAGTGETNTASNLGGGEGTFAQKNVADLEFKSITAGLGMQVTSNTTEITVAANVAMNQLSDVITTGVTPGQVLKYDGSNWVADNDLQSIGETNTASSRPGTGEEVYSTKIGTDLQFKRILGGSNIVVTSTGDEITIDTSSSVGETNEGTNIGAGEGIYTANIGTDLQFKSLVAGTNAIITSNSTEITIDAVNPLAGVVTPANGEGLIYTGGAWVNQQLTKSNISDFVEDDYATGAEGDLAVSAIQPLDNVSELTNDVGYLTGASVLNDLFDTLTPTPATGEVLKYNGTQWVNSPDTAAANTASNLGAGEGVYAQQVSQDLQFKSLTAGSGISFVSTGTEIEITSTASGGGEINTASNLGGGEGVFFQKSGDDLELKSIAPGTGISITSDDDEITITSSVTVPSNINDLDDVDTVTSAPATNEVLAWNGSNWVPTGQSGGGVTELTNLTDTTGAATGLGYLRWNSLGTVVTYETTIPYGVVSGAPTVVDWTVDQSGTMIDPANYVDTDTDTTYVDTDWDHDLLTNYAANEHIDWTVDQSGTMINPANYTSGSGGGTDWELANQGTIHATNYVGNTITNLSNGAGSEGLYFATVGLDFKLKSLRAGDLIELTADGSEIEINSTLPDGNGSHDIHLYYNDGEGFEWITTDIRTIWQNLHEFNNSGPAYTVDFDDVNGIIVSSCTVPNTVTVIKGLEDAGLPTGYGGLKLEIVQKGTGVTTLVAGADVILTPPPGRGLILQQGQTATLTLQQNDSSSDKYLVSYSGIDSSSGGASELNDLSDVIITAATSGEVLRHNGSEFVDAQLDYTDLANPPTIPTTPAEVGADADGTAQAAITAHEGDANYRHIPVGGTTGQILKVDGGGAIAWDTDASGAGATDILFTPTAGAGTLTSSTGSDTTIPLADGTNAGLMTSAEQAAIAANSLKANNVTTDLTYTAASLTGTVNSSDGDNATLPAATTSLAGLMTGPDKVLLDALVLEGPESNQNAFGTVSISGNTSGDASMVSDGPTDTVTLIGGSNINLIGSFAGDSITIEATGGGSSSPTTTQGDMIVRGTAGDERLATGADTQVLTRDDTATNGIAWKDASASGGIMYEKAVFRFQNGDWFNPAQSVLSTNLSVSYTATAANTTTFSFINSVYNMPPVGIAIWAQNATNNTWSLISQDQIISGTTHVDTGTSGTPALPDSGNEDILNDAVAFTGTTSMNLTLGDTGATNWVDGFNPTVYAKVMVLFTMIG